MEALVNTIECKKLKEVKKMLKLDGVYNKSFKFVCHADGIATYTLKEEGFLHEINIIVDSELFRKEKVKHLLKLGGIKFFSYSVYSIEINGAYDKAGSVMYRPLAND